MPSAKYALAMSSLRFSNGRMAMLFSGIETAPLLAVSSGGVDRVILSDTCWKKVKELITIARAATTKAITSRALGHRGRLTGRTTSHSCFHLLLRLSFSDLWITEILFAEIEKVQPQSVLHFALAQIVQV